MVSLKKKTYRAYGLPGIPRSVKTIRGCGVIFIKVVILNAENDRNEDYSNAKISKSGTLLEYTNENYYETILLKLA